MRVLDGRVPVRLRLIPIGSLLVAILERGDELCKVSYHVGIVPVDVLGAFRHLPPLSTLEGQSLT